MTLIPDCSAFEKNVVRAGLYRDGVVSVENHAVGDFDVGSCDVETVGVEWETAGRGVGVDNGVADIDVVSNQLNVPRYWLARFEATHRSVCCVEAQ